MLLEVRVPINSQCSSASRARTWASGTAKKKNPFRKQIGAIHFIANQSLVGLLAFYLCLVCLPSGQPPRKWMVSGSATDGPVTHPSRAFAHLFCISAHPDRGEICCLSCRCEGHLRFPACCSVCSSCLSVSSNTKAALSESEFHYAPSAGDPTRSNKFVSPCQSLDY